MAKTIKITILYQLAKNSTNILRMNFIGLTTNKKSNEKKMKCFD